MTAFNDLSNWWFHRSFICWWVLKLVWQIENIYDAVLSKVHNPESPNGPPIMGSWVVHITFGWCVCGQKSWWDPYITSEKFIFNYHQGLNYPKISLSIEGTIFLFEILQSLWNLTGCSAPVLPSHLSPFKWLEYFSKLHTVVKCRKICRKFIGRKTDYTRCKYGLPVPFMDPIWWLGDCFGQHWWCSDIGLECFYLYRQVSNIRRTLVGNKIVDNSDVVGASPVGAAPTTSSLST